MRPAKRMFLGVAALAAILASAGEALALRVEQHSNWMFGIGYGLGRGAITALVPGETELFDSEYRNAASPHIRIGRMLGRRFMVGIHWESWLTEFGSQRAPDVKIRRTLQNLALGITWFPGNLDGVSGGIFLRGGAGLGWSGTGAKEAIEGEPQHRGERLDEYGLGVFGEGGYEFWLTRNVTAAAALTYNYFDIGTPEEIPPPLPEDFELEEFVESGWFASAVFHLNLYF